MDDMKVMFVFIRVMLADESYVPQVGDFRSRNFWRGLLTLFVPDLGLSSFVNKETL